MPTSLDGQMPSSFFEQNQLAEGAAFPPSCGGLVFVITLCCPKEMRGAGKKRQNRTLLKIGRIELMGLCKMLHRLVGYTY